MIDYKMPDMNGIELAQPLAQPRHRHADHPDHRLSRRKYRGKGRGRRHRHVLLKPHLEESLVSRIRGAIQEGQLAGR